MIRNILYIFAVNLILCVMAIKCIKELKFGDFFTLKFYGDENVSERSVWVRGEYDKSSKTYSCYKFVDICHEHFFKGSKLVFVDFDF